MRFRDIHERRDDGFTLIELLVVILIIGILASIALPAFLSQRQKAHDGDAKANVRSLASLMAACYEEADGYESCSATIALNEAGLPLGTTPGRVRVVSASTTTFSLEGVSRAETAGAHHRFSYVYDVSAGTTVRRCTPFGAGGCRDETADPLVGEW